MKYLLATIVAAFAAVVSAAPIPLGNPNRGQLNDGEDIYKIIDTHKDLLKSVSPEEFQFGTHQMANTIVSVGNWAKEFHLAPVWIGDISKKDGGKLAQHMTHQRGLDADIGYLVHEHKLEGHRANKFHDKFTEQFGVNGIFSKNFDLEKNYLVFKRLFAEQNVSSIYVGCGIYDKLEAYDKAQTQSIMDHVYAQKGHEDHFHIRIRCPNDVTECSNDWWQNPTKRPKKKRQSSNGKFRDC